VILGFNVALTLPNVFGIDIVASASVFFAWLVIVPVAVFVLVCVPHMQPKNWLAVPAEVNLVGFLNLVLWNTNGWDVISTCGGEVREPIKTFPRAILAAQALVILPYMLMILAATAVDPQLEMYHIGWYNEVALQEGGKVLGTLFAIGTVAGVMGMFVADMTAYSYQVAANLQRHACVYTCPHVYIRPLSPEQTGV
jgi:amino acid transporter